MLENYAKKRAVKNCLKRTSNKNTGLWNEHDFAAIRTNECNGLKSAWFGGFVQEFWTCCKNDNIFCKAVCIC